MQRFTRPSRSEHEGHASSSWLSTSDGRSETQGLLALAIKAPTPIPALDPTAVNDGVKVDASAGQPVYGNVLANDYDLNGDAVFLRTLGSARVADHEAMVGGMYGELGFMKNGDFRYELDQSRVEGLDGVVQESFYYKNSDGSLQDTGALSSPSTCSRLSRPKPTRSVWRSQSLQAPPAQFSPDRATQ